MSDRYALTCEPDPGSNGCFVIASVRLTEKQASQMSDALLILNNVDALMYGHTYNDAIVIEAAVRYDAARQRGEIQRRFDGGELVGLS